MKNQRNQPPSLGRRDLLQTTAIGAAAIATLSSMETRVEAATTDSDPLREKQLADVPSDYDKAYVENVIIPFLRTNIYEVERPALPMIDVLLSKDLALSGNIAPLLYDNWQPDPEGEGVTVFIQGLEKRGPDCPASAPTRQKGRIEIGRIFGPL
jgi:hypothetical protein